MCFLVNELFIIWVYAEALNSSQISPLPQIKYSDVWPLKYWFCEVGWGQEPFSNHFVLLWQFDKTRRQLSFFFLIGLIKCYPFINLVISDQESNIVSEWEFKASIMTIWCQDSNFQGSSVHRYIFSIHSTIILNIDKAQIILIV